MSLWKRYKPYILQVLLALAVGGLSALISGEMDEYTWLAKPPLSPPGWVFPVAWTVLYVLMGVAAGLVQTSGDKDSGGALLLYYVQLAVNFLWSPIFFGLGWIGFAAVWLALLTVAVYATKVRFGAVSPVAGWLLLPYFIWCIFALYLNLGFVILN
ncbi:MAG: tryptophan-rich sensory protein [Ruminococcaceae bacterium]|nr:tryptophan-rich sensory protein [Oscillospiraceae bacterium]